MRLRDGARVLARGDGSLQVGVRAPLVLKGLTAAQRRFVERLEGGRPVTPHEAQAFADLVSRLDAAGLFRPAPAGRASVCIDDAGPVGLALGVTLARDGWAVRYRDTGLPAASPPRTYADGSVASTRQAAAIEAVSRQVPGADVRVGSAVVDAWVLISAGAAALPAAVPLMAADAPHLFVVPDERGIEVGPLVVPGVSACGTCAGLYRASVDPEWPSLALQLAAGGAEPVRATADVAATAAGLAAGALAAWRAGEPEAWLNGVWAVTESLPPAARGLAPSPDCGCGAAGPVGDELAARRARFGGG